MASEALVESSDIGAFALSPVPEQVDSVEADWNAVGETSNKWVEALLQESPAEVFDFGAVSLDTARRTVTCHGRYTRFSPLDFALLLILARHKIGLFHILGFVIDFGAQPARYPYPVSVCMYFASDKSSRESR